MAHAHYFSGPWNQVVILSVVALEPYTIWVNKRGECFVDGGIPLPFRETANALYRQPDRVSYHLFDEKMKQSMIQNGVKVGVGEFFTEHLIPKTKLADLEEQLPSQKDQGLVKISQFLG